jgi:D-inositol-3-phosphate glycosyltransferase
VVYPARFVFVGVYADERRDSHETELRRRVARLGLERAVLFAGAQSQDRLRDYYVAADATVLPSYYESFGMVALEAMACGSAVIASRVGGLQTTVRDGVTGLLVSEADPCALAGTIARVLDDGALRWRLGREGVRWAAAHRWPCVAEAICREYAALAVDAEPHLAVARCR